MTRIRIEASSVCQLRCPSCPTATRAALPVLGKGWLRFNDFRALVDLNPGIEEIELSNYGEMFLNPELLPILEWAHERGVTLTCDNGANLNHLTSEMAEALVRFGFRSITVSIDGASPETYAVYRKGGDYDRVIANIRLINEQKERYRSSFPYLTWQVVVFSHNEHELPAARELAQQLGMAFFAKLSWDEARPEGYMDDICEQLWDAPQINWDGKVLGCCRNYWGEFGGNVFHDGLSRSLNSETMQYARRMLLGEAPARADVPCSMCRTYLDRRNSGNWVQPKNVSFLPIVEK